MIVESVEKINVKNQISLDQLLGKLDGVKKSGSYFMARCPCHDDENCSLQIQRFDSGVIYVKCWTGCAGDAIAEKLGIKANCKDTAFAYHPESSAKARKAVTGDEDLFTTNITPKDLAAHVKLPLFDLFFEYGIRQDSVGVQIPYKDAKGLSACTRLRTALKAKDGSRWYQSKDGKDRIIPYGLWMLEDFKKRKRKALFIVEGESDCWTLWHNGFAALGIPGATLTKKLTLEMVKDWDTLYLWQEPDKGGDAFVTGLYERLKDVGYTGKILVISSPKFKDPNELWKSRPEPREFKESMGIIVKEGADVEKCLSVPQVQPTELKFAFALTRKFGGELRYSSHLKGWLAWDGKHWQTEADYLAVRKLIEFLDLYKDQVKKLPNQERREKILGELKKCETNARINAILSLAANLAPIRVANVEEFDADRWLFNCQNGTIDLRTGELLPHDPRHLITHLSPVTYDPSLNWRDAKVFCRSLDLWWGKQEGLAEYMQQAVGCSLTGMPLKVLFFLWGPGDNGKSTFVNLIRYLLSTYGRGIRVESLLQKDNSSAIPNDIAALRGARFVNSSEIPSGRSLNEALVKDLTGTDVLTARFLHHEFFKFSPQYKLWMSGNHKPKVTDGETAIWNRIRLIPFTQPIPAEKRDVNIEQKLQDEAPFILKWAVEGCLRWLAEGWSEPECVRVATLKYRAENDSVSAFLSEKVVDGEKVQKSQLYSAYFDWCRDNELETLKKNSFSSVLMDNFGWTEIRTVTARYWAGHSLQPDVAT